MAETEARAAALAAVSDAGRRLSTAMILFHTNLAKRVDLGPTDEKVLDLVLRLGTPSAGELVEQTGLAKNSITAVIDRLERRGFVTRHADAADRRRVRVTASAAGVERFRGHFIGMMTRLDALNERYSTEELRLIADYQQQAAAIQLSEAQRLGEAGS